LSDTHKIVGEGLTYDDVLIIPMRADLLPREVDTRSRLTREVEIKLPLVSAAMDTVTESQLAIALAQQGGVGVIHKNLSLERQIHEVDLVKRSANGVILDPVTLTPEQTAGQAKELMRVHNISGLPVIDGDEKVLGIVTSRDLRFQTSPDKPVVELMTKSVVTSPANTTLEAARDIIHLNKIEKLRPDRRRRPAASVSSRSRTSRHDRGVSRRLQG
jgi:IMP dehydrogenase